MKKTIIYLICMLVMLQGVLAITTVIRDNAFSDFYSINLTEQLCFDATSCISSWDDVNVTGAGDTNASTICDGTTTYLDGDGGCDDISGVYVQAGDWTTIDNYPSACTAGQYVSAIGDTLTCSEPAGGSYDDSWINTTIDSKDVAVNTSLKDYVDTQDSAQDACSEITGCVENAITDGNTNWDNSYGFYNDVANITGLGFVTGEHTNLSDSDVEGYINDTGKYYDIQINCSNVIFDNGVGSAGICDGVDTEGGAGGFEDVNITTDSGDVVIADSEILSIVGGTNCSTVGSGNTVTINCIDTDTDTDTTCDSAECAVTNTGTLDSYEGADLKEVDAQGNLDIVGNLSIGAQQTNSAKIIFKTFLGTGLNFTLALVQKAWKGDGTIETWEWQDNTGAKQFDMSSTGDFNLSRDLYVTNDAHIYNDLCVAGECINNWDDVNSSITDTNASTICDGTTTYLDGDGGCDDISGVYVQAGDWTTIDSYPEACEAGDFVTTIGDTLTCDTPSYIADTTVNNTYANFSMVTIGERNTVASGDLNMTGNIGIGGNIYMDNGINICQNTTDTWMGTC